MKNILVPIDFSPVSRRTLAEAVRLAVALRMRIWLQHVVPNPTYAENLYGGTVDVLALLHDAAKAAGRHLRRIRDRHPDLMAVLPVETGHPPPIILAQARRLRAAFIVLGSHGHGAAYDLLAGSVAQAVLRRATCPVVVVPARGRPKPKA